MIDGVSCLHSLCIAALISICFQWILTILGSSSTKGGLSLWHCLVKKRLRPGPKIRRFSSQSDNIDIFFIRSNKHIYFAFRLFSGQVKDNATEPHGSGRGGYWWRPLTFLSINSPQDCSRPSKLRLNAHFYSANTVALSCTRPWQEAFFNSQDETRNNKRQI